jgi:hypothetical protein
MRFKHIILVFFLHNTVIAQTGEENYTGFVQQGDSLFKLSLYKTSGLKYSQAFAVFGGRGYPEDRYNAARSWAMAGFPDSAFLNLMKIATIVRYSEYDTLTNDKDLNSLHSDARWEKLLKIVSNNKKQKELDKPIISMLDSIYSDDQTYRLQLDEIENKFGFNSAEMKTQWRKIKQKDSVNLKKVVYILDTYGWLGANRVGNTGNATLFLVIQHSDQQIQEKYLPMMREAVKKGNAYASDLALLEDRVLLGQGKKQVYGSQLRTNSEGKTTLSPLEDPDNVDKRRADVGLQPLGEYLKHWNLVWDVEEYKKSQQK